MRSEKSILTAFILNLAFAVFEFFGGIFTGSVAIVSDAVHDLGDAASLGAAYFFENKSNGEPNGRYTYGYGRYSVLGGFITTVILFSGSAAVISNAVKRILDPAEINYGGMIIFAIAGVVINSAAAYFTGHGGSVNHKAVNLHMLEDVLGWIVVLIGAVIMRFTDLAVIDPLMSIGVAVFILVNSVKNLKEIFDIFLEKSPASVDMDELSRHICEIDGVADVHHIHLWTMDGINHYATMHVVARGDNTFIKAAVRREAEEHGIFHVTIEIEDEAELCGDFKCEIKHSCEAGHHHHRH